LFRSSIEKRYVEIKTVNNIKTGRHPIKDDKFKPLGVLNLPYLEDDNFMKKNA
jgi:hypothetical protein